MHLVGKNWLLDLSSKHKDAAKQVAAWIAVVEASRWTSPHDVRQWDVHVSLPGSNRAIFNIRHNKYRIDVRIDYAAGLVIVDFAGTHAEYDRRNRG